MIAGAGTTILVHIGLITLILRLAIAKKVLQYFKGNEMAGSNSVNDSA
jgi:hypothetical protein